MKFINPFQRNLNVGGPLVVDGSDFDGTNDYMQTGAALSGVTDSKKGILSFWIRIDGGDGVRQDILHIDRNLSGAENFVCFKSGASNLIVIQAYNAALSNVLNCNTAATTFTSSPTWRHVLASWDLAIAAVSIYVDDISSVSTSVATNSDIAYSTSAATSVVGYSLAGSNLLNGCLAELYFAPGQYIDFSIEANRRKLRSVDGKPVNILQNGAYPTLIAPAIYLHLDDGEAVANFATNRGTGGNFTITGTLDTASTSPSD